MQSPIDDYFFAARTMPYQMDMLWGQGWRHFGTYFFRYAKVLRGDEVYHVLPLRVALSRFRLSTSQKRILKKNQDLQVVIHSAVIDEAKEALFHRHKTRFTENVPNSLYDFLAPDPHTSPCKTIEIQLIERGKMVGVTFLDLGDHATSSVYSIYEPTETKRSLGIYLILLSIQYSLQTGKEYYYPGYAYREPSFYDYKKRLGGLESYDWKEWREVIER